MGYPRSRGGNTGAQNSTAMTNGLSPLARRSRVRQDRTLELQTAAHT